MKVLFVLTYYRPHWTGLTQYAARLAEGLVQRGDEVEVVCIQHQKDLAKEEVVDGVRVVRLPSIFRISRTQIAPSFPLKLFELARKSEVVVAYLPLAEAILVAIIARILGRKLFLIHNGDLVLPARVTNRLLERIYYLTTGVAIRLSNAIIVQTKDYSSKSKLLSRFENKWRVILPLYTVGNATKKEVDSFKKEEGLEGKQLVGFSGRFVEEKGIESLLEVIPEVISKNPDAHFVFAGEYKVPYESSWGKIKALIEKKKSHLTLLGLVRSEKRLAVYYSALDVLVLPSRSDCFPSAQVEALLCGIPVVCTDVPGARWVVETTKMGLLVKPGDLTALANGIVKVLKSRKQYIKPKAEVERIFNYEETIGQYKELFES